MSNKSAENVLDLSGVLDASLTDAEKTMLQTTLAITEDFKVLQKKEEETRDHLFILGNLLLGIFTVGIVHAIFYIGSLIAYGSQFQKWESTDPITWFFHRVNASVVLKKTDAEEVDIGVEEKNADENTLGKNSALSASS